MLFFVSTRGAPLTKQTPARGTGHLPVMLSVLAIALLLPLFASEAGAAPPDTVRVLTYNVKHGQGMDGKVDLARSAAVIRRLQPDVVLLQEIDQGTRRTEGVLQAKRLSELTGMPHYAFGKFMDYGGGAYGMALLSKHPLEESQNYRLPAGAEPRSALAGRIRIGEKELVVAGVHLYRTLEQRYAQAQRLVELFEDAGAPVILAGDFNSEPASRVIDLLQRHWVIPEKGADHLTFPSDDPRVEIDYIMYRPAEAFTVTEHRVVDEPLASDHRPVLIELVL